MWMKVQNVIEKARFVKKYSATSGQSLNVSWCRDNFTEWLQEKLKTVLLVLSLQLRLKNRADL